MMSLKDLQNTDWGKDHLVICGIPEKKEFTEMEKQTIDLIRSDIEWDSKDWVEYWILENYSKIEGIQLRGVLSSLVKKGVLETKEGDSKETTQFKLVK